MTTSSERPLTFIQIGDLHLTDAKQRNFSDLLSIVAQIEIECAPMIDFVFLPGDNADNGLPPQYALASTALKMLSKPVHAITGDHDMEQGNLTAFYGGLSRDGLPKAVSLRGYRCLFLDICGTGEGGPDFRLGAKQYAWLERELATAKSAGERCLMFVHTYPADLKGEGECAQLTHLIADNEVALVAMGHTHYNELANDGRTVFAATRSTGQIEEGPVGYTVVTVDNGVVSWRFKPLDDAFPFVMITSPADYRLRRDDHDATGDKCTVRAVVLGSRGVSRVRGRIGAQAEDWFDMTRDADGAVWSAEVLLPDEMLPDLIVEAWDSAGRPGQHAIRVATQAYKPPRRVQDGSDASAIGAWPENGIFGTQLGPNRNGKPLS